MVARLHQALMMYKIIPRTVKDSTYVILNAEKNLRAVGEHLIHCPTGRGFLAARRAMRNDKGRVFSFRKPWLVGLTHLI
ncbi:MAG: hypothetical protein BGO39_10975 [Chloroflexi bacterium 54-19]|nr:MAG: hypothetical protein BGO39_10975 [Chloroflexi bacterium 54-19]